MRYHVSKGSHSRDAEPRHLSLSPIESISPSKLHVPGLWFSTIRDPGCNLDEVDLASLHRDRHELCVPFRGRHVGVKMGSGRLADVDTTLDEFIPRMVACLFVVSADFCLFVVSADFCLFVVSADFCLFVVSADFCLFVVSADFCLSPPTSVYSSSPPTSVYSSSPPTSVYSSSPPTSVYSSSPPTAISRSSRLRTLPVGLRGSSSRKTTSRGTL
jgi:hypothetical protein